VCECEVCARVVRVCELCVCVSYECVRVVSVCEL
jgi:hypothetical protein